MDLFNILDLANVNFRAGVRITERNDFLKKRILLDAKNISTGTSKLPRINVRTPKNYQIVDLFNILDLANVNLRTGVRIT